MSEKDMQDKVDDITTTTFSIAGIPIREFRRFVDFCERNAKITKVFYDKVSGKKQIKEDLCYAIGISRLVDIADGNAAIQMLYDKITALELKSAEPPKEKGRMEIKTMGRKDEVKEK